MKWKSMVCGVAMAGLLLAPAHAADFSDTKDYWAKPAIERWSDYGVIGGYSDGTFRPNKQITRAEMAVILSRIFGWQDMAENTFTDISGKEWYAESLLRAKSAGVMGGYGDGSVRPNNPITRQEAAVMISRALHISGSDSGKTFGDSGQIGAWAAGAINGMSQKGFIGGSADGNFYPLNSITRAATVTILDRAIANYYNKAGNYSADAAGITVIAAPGVTLQNMTVDGDLFIAPGANDSEVILKHVTVTGQTYIQSGRGTQVLLSGSRLEQISVEGANARVTFDGGEFKELVVSGDQAALRGLDEKDQVTVAAGTSGVVINGHNAGPGTVTAGKDVSTDDDDVEIEIEISGGTASGGSTGGGSTGSGTTGGGTAGEETPGGGTAGEETPGGGSSEGGTPTPPDNRPEETEPPKSNVDENGNIIIDFGDLLKPKP